MPHRPVQSSPVRVWRGLLALTLAWFVLRQAPPALAAEACLPAPRHHCANETRTALMTPRRVLLPPATSMGLSSPAHEEVATHALLSQTTLGTPPHEALRARGETLLLREILNVRRLLDQTPQNDPIHPRALRRLAESYVELASSAQLNHQQQLKLARVVGTINRARAEMLRQRAAAAASQERRARLKAVGLYRQLLSQHPNYCRFPHHPARNERSCSDEVLRYLAYELDLLHESSAAQESYRALLNTWPGSRHAPSAALAVAEFTFAEAQRFRASWQDAAGAYRRMLRYPHTPPQLRAYTQYKLGHAQRSANRPEHAIAAFAQVIELVAPLLKAQHNSPSQRLQELLNAARKDLLTAYALAGDPLQAHAFFHGFSGDRDGSFERTDRMVEALGAEMFRNGQLHAAARLYRQLAQNQPAPARRCRYLALAAQAEHASEPAAVRETLELLGQMHQTRRASHDTKTKNVCDGLMVAVAGDSALTWHLETLGNDHARGTNNPTTLAAAKTALSWLLPPTKPASDTTSAVPRQWRARRAAALHYAYGELALREGPQDARRYDDCVTAFTNALKLAPNGARASDAAIAASRCWRAAHSKHDALVPADMRAKPHQPLASLQQQALVGLDAFACHVDPRQSTTTATTESNAANRWVEYAAVAGQRSHLYLDQGQLEEATSIQRELAFAQRGRLGLAAAQNYLAGLRAFMHTGERPQCIATDRKDRARLKQRYCNKRPAHEALTIRRMRRQLCRDLVAKH